MNPYRPDDSHGDATEPDRAERLAAEWALRQEQGLTIEEEAELAHWLAEDDAHLRLFTEMTQTSRLLEGMKFQLGAPPSTREGVRLAPSGPTRLRRLRWLAAAGGLAAAVAMGVGVWQWVGPGRDYATVAATQLGEVKRLELPDGSVALLNTNTAVEVSYKAEERRVRLLSGEAFFTVAKNPHRPFIVQAGRIGVRAVGTAFDVRFRKEALSVLVTEGKVRVSGAIPAGAAKEASAAPAVGPAMEPLLEKGHMARVAFDADRAPSPEGLVVSAMEERAIKSALAWQEGRLEFFETPLSEVVAEFNRYNRHKIVIADPALAARRFGGAFASHQVEPFLELLEQSFGVVAEEHGNETIIRQVK